MDKLLTLQEAKSILNVSKSTLQRWDIQQKMVNISKNNQMLANVCTPRFEL